MLELLRKTLPIGLFIVLLLLALLSFGMQSISAGSSDLRFRGTELVKIAENTSYSSAPIQSCIEISNDILNEFESLLTGLSHVTIHTDSKLRRGLSDGEVIYVRCLSDEVEFANVLIHEIGHVVDLSYLRGTESASDTPFDDFGDAIKSDDESFMYYNLNWVDAKNVKDGTNRTSFVSTYGQSDPFEDFAESFLMYVRYGELFRYLAYKTENPDLLKKYIYMKTVVFDGKEFNIDKPLSLEGIRIMRQGQNELFDMTKLHNLV